MAESRHATRSPAEVLAAWRDAERRLDELAPGTGEWHAARLQADDLAAEYQRRIAERADEARDLGSGPSAEVTLRQADQPVEL
jgi:hypothetical protein